MIGIENHRDPVSFGGGIDIMSAGNPAENRSALAFFGNSFANEKLGSAIAELNHHGSSGGASGSQGRIDRIGAGAIDRRESEIIFFGVIKELFDFIAEEDSGPECFGSTHDLSIVKGASKGLPSLLASSNP
jgi:hypothetical protein